MKPHNDLELVVTLFTCCYAIARSTVGSQSHSWSHWGVLAPKVVVPHCAVHAASTICVLPLACCVSSLKSLSVRVIFSVPVSASPGSKSLGISWFQGPMSLFQIPVSNVQIPSSRFQAPSSRSQVPSPKLEVRNLYFFCASNVA